MTSDTEQTKAAEFELPPRLDTDSAPELRDDLIAMRGAPATLLAAEVGHLGARCMGVLLAAANTWREDGYALTIENASEPFLTGLDRMGVSLDNLTVEATDATGDAA